jgi:signal transduction histidine kinase
MRLTDPHEVAEAIGGAREALLADWRRRLRKLLGEGEHSNSAVPALLLYRRGSMEKSDRPEIDGAAVLARVVDALERQDAGGCGEGGANDEWIRRSPSRYAVEQIGTLRACLNDFMGAQGFARSGRAHEIVGRALDYAIFQAARPGALDEADDSGRNRAEQIAFVAHDLRAPLNAISLAADVLERILSTASDDGLARRMLHSIRRNVEQLSVLAEQVLDRNAAADRGVIAPHRRPLELCPLVQAVVQELEPLARSVGTRVVNIVPAGLIVHADGDLLARVFQNLIANAVDHAPGGEVVVGAEAASAGGAVVCWVRDDGTGIAAREIGRVFRKGETTRPEDGEAHGLGLPIVEQVVEAHGGRIAVESAEGFGATFWFELPALGGSAAH